MIRIALVAVAIFMTSAAFAATGFETTFVLTLPPGVTCPITTSFVRMVPGGTAICTLSPAGSYSVAAPESAEMAIVGGVLVVGGTAIMRSGTIAVTVTTP